MAICNRCMQPLLQLSPNGQQICPECDKEEIFKRVEQLKKSDGNDSDLSLRLLARVIESGSPKKLG